METATEMNRMKQSISRVFSRVSDKTLKPRQLYGHSRPEIRIKFNRLNKIIDQSKRGYGHKCL